MRYQHNLFTAKSTFSRLQCCRRHYGSIFIHLALLPPKIMKSGEIPKKNLTLQQFWVIQGHRSWCQWKAHVCDFYPPLPYLRPRLECRDEIWLQKTRVLGLPEGEEIMTLAFFVLTQYRLVTNGRTDRQTRYDRYYPR